MATTATAAPNGDPDDDRGHARPTADPKSAKKRTLRNPTSSYQAGGGMWWGMPSSVIDGAPFFTWWDVPRMLRDPRVRLAERMWRAPFQRVKWKVNAEHPTVARFVGTTLRSIWRKSLPRILARYFRYGFAPGGAEFCERKGLVRLGRVRAVEPMDATPHVWAAGRNAGQAAGFTIRSGISVGVTTPTDAWVGPRHAVWFSGNQEFSQFYDLPPMSGMFEPWLEKRGRNGAIHARRLWFRKCAFRGAILHHPQGTTAVGPDESSQVIDNQDLARQTLEYAESGAVYTFTNEVNPSEPGKYAWDLQEAVAQPDVKGVREYPQDLDKEMLEGIGMPPEVLEAADVGSGWSGRLIPLIGFLGGVDELAGMLIECFDSPIRHLVGVNFGKDTYYEVEPQSLAEEVQTAAKGGPGGGEGANPLAGMFGGGPPKDQPNPTPVSMSDGRTDVWDVAVRRARRLAKRRRSAARELSWEPYQGAHGGRGWKNPDSGEIRYQEDKPTDGKGDGDVPSDAAALHRGADSKAKAILRAAVKVPKRFMGKVRDKVKATYAKLDKRYGPRYAKAIVAAGLTGLPVPLPGASVMMAAPVIAVAELHRQLSKMAGGADHRTGSIDPSIVKPAAGWFVGRLMGKARAAMHLSWAGAGPVELADGRADDKPAAKKPDEKPAADSNASAWSPHGQSRGGTNRWINTATGEVRYQESKPGEHSTAGAETVFSGHPEYDKFPEHANGKKLDAATAKAIRDEYHQKALAAGLDPDAVHHETASDVADDVDKHAIYAREYNRLNPHAQMVFGRLSEPKKLREHYETNLRHFKTKQESDRFDTDYFSEDDPKKRAKAWIKGASASGHIDPEQLSGDTIDAISEDLAESLNHKQLLAHYADVLAVYDADNAGAKAVEQALAKKPAVPPLAFDGRKPEKWVAVYTFNAGKGVPASVLAAIPRAAVNAGDSLQLLPAKDAVGRKILESHGGDEYDLDTDDGAGELFDSLTSPPVVGDKDVPASARDYGTTSGHLDPSKVGDDWAPNNVDVYKRVGTSEWYAVKRGDGNPEADEKGIYGFVHRSQMPPTSRLPAAYWAKLHDRHNAFTDSDAQERTQIKGEKATPQGALDKVEIRATGTARDFTKAAAKVKAEHARIGNAVRSLEALHAKATGLADEWSFGDDDVKTADNGSRHEPAVAAVNDLQEALDAVRDHDAPEFDYDPDEIDDFDASALDNVQHASRAEHREVADQVYQDFNEWQREASARTRESLDSVKKVAPEYRKGLREKLDAVRKAAQKVLTLPDGVLDGPHVKEAAAAVNRATMKLIGRTARKAHLMSDDRAGGAGAGTGDLVKLIAIAMLKAQERATAAGRPETAAPYLEQLGQLAGDPEQVSEIVGGAKLLSWSPYEGSRGGHGWKNDETGRIVYGKAKPGERRQKAQASAAAARDILHKVATLEATPEHLEELADHLPALKVEQLRRARALLDASWGGSRLKRDGMVAAILAHVRAKVVEMRANPDGTPEPEPATPRKEQQFKPKAGKVYTLPTHTLNVDPARFQFKLNTGNAAGVTDEMKQVTEWNPDFAGVTAAWHDPEDGKTYVVNGHHRRELAGRLGVKNMDVRFIDAPDAKTARAKGALINIAEGRGTAVDAAKFMRDTGVTIEDFAKHGVPLKAGALADQATTLTKLNDKAFDRVASGDLEVSKALAVAKHLADPDRQEKLFRLLEKREDEGKDISPRTMEEMARAMASAPSVTKTESTLWGPEETTEDVFVQRAELAGAVRADLAKELGNWAAVSSAKRAASVADAGNTLNVDENKKRAEAAEQGKNLYDTLVNRKGPISDALNAGAVKLANAKTKKERERARLETTDAVRAAIRAEFDKLDRKPAGEADGRGEGGPVRGDQGAPDAGQGGAPEPERPATERTGLTAGKAGDTLAPGGDNPVAPQEGQSVKEPKEPHEMTRAEYESHATAIPKEYGVWNDEVGDDRYSKRLSQTDKIFEKVVKQKLAEVVPGEEWPFDPVNVKRESGPHELKDGHHRIEVAKRLGMKVIPATLVDQKAFGHTRPVNTYVEIGDDGEPRVVQPNNESLPPIKVTVPETKPGKKKPDYGKAHRAAVKAAIAAGKPVPPEVLADYPDLAAKHRTSPEDTPMSPPPPPPPADPVPAQAPSVPPPPPPPAPTPRVDPRAAPNPVVAGKPLFGGGDPSKPVNNVYEDPKKVAARVAADDAAHAERKAALASRIRAVKANPAAWPDIEADILDNRTGRQETIDLSKSLFPHLHEQAKRLPKAKIVALMKQELGIA